MAELAPRLARQGCEVTVFTRAGYRSEPGPPPPGVRLAQRPCVRTRHLEAVSHSALCAAQAMRGYDLVHFHALGPVVVLLASAPERARGGGNGARAGPRPGQMGPRRARRPAPGRAGLGPFSPHRDHGLAHTWPSTIARPTGWRRRTSPTARPRPSTGPWTACAAWGWTNRGTCSSWAGWCPKRACTLWWRPSEAWTRRAAWSSQATTATARATSAPCEGWAGGDPRIVFTGPLFGADKDEVLSNAALFVLPSELEGMPIALLEAASHALALLASDIPACMEVFGHGGATPSPPGDFPRGRRGGPGPAHGGPAR